MKDEFKKLSIIIPAYNEAATIHEILNKIKEGFEMRKSIVFDLDHPHPGADSYRSVLTADERCSRSLSVGSWVWR